MRLNKKQRAAIWLGIGGFVLTAAFPPWEWEGMRARQRMTMWLGYGTWYMSPHPIKDAEAVVALAEAKLARVQAKIDADTLGHLLDAQLDDQKETELLPEALGVSDGLERPALKPKATDANDQSRQLRQLLDRIEFNIELEKAQEALANEQRQRFGARIALHYLLAEWLGLILVVCGAVVALKDNGRPKS